MTDTRLLLDHVETPIGRLAIVADDEGRLRAAGWTDGHSRMERLLRAHATAMSVSLVPAANPGGVSAAMTAYFAGELAALDALPVAFAGGSRFQFAVWHALRRIPCGKTVSYGELARLVGSPSAARAVGLAAGANPIAVVLPCHRVIGSDGSMTGYGGGIDRKRWLLAHELGRDPHPQLALC
jgi:methylated-DNA-[protein]-cysteine S-methyltransferase